jgi:hypothetical protein
MCKNIEFVNTVTLRKKIKIRFRFTKFLDFALIIKVFVVTRKKKINFFFH